MLVVSSVLGDQLGLVRRNIAGKSFAIFSTLEVVVRPFRSLGDYAEFTRFHALDLGDLLEQLSSGCLVHGLNIYVCI